MEKNKKKIMYSILTIVGVFLLLLGVTYAYWLITKQQTKENIITTGCLNFSLMNELNDISLLNAYPITDKEGKDLTPYTFTLQNECDDYVSYDISLEVLNGTDLENDHYIKTALNEAESPIKPVYFDSFSAGTTTIDGSLESRILEEEILEPNATKDYELRLWLDYDTPAVEEAMEKTFKSKIMVTGEFLDINTLPPTASLALSSCEGTVKVEVEGSAAGEKQITKYEYQLDEKPWEEQEEPIKEFTEVEEGPHTIKVKVTDSKNVTSEEVVQEIDTTTKNTSILGQEIPIATCKSGLYEITHTDTTLGSGWDTTEYRYAGPSYVSEETEYPHHYVRFNNELWRMIGLVNVKDSDGSITQRVKIIRDESIGDFYLDQSATSSWITFTTKNMLNDSYYNSTIGDCIISGGSFSTVQSTCDFSGTNETYPKGLDETAQKMIDKDVIWSLGDTKNEYNSSSTTSEFYDFERIGDEEWTKENDPTYHNGVGLINVSDFGYATSGGTFGQAKCLKKAPYSWYNPYAEEEVNYMTECGENSFIKPSNDCSWTISGYTYGLINSERGQHSICDGGVKGYMPSYEPNFQDDGIYPVVYLNSTVTINGGSGTHEDPYLLETSL